MRSWTGYALASAFAVGIAGGIVAWLMPGAAEPVWFAALIAYGVQLVAFGVMTALQPSGDPAGFMMAWGGGIALRFLAVAATAIWVTQAASLAAEPLLVSLVGFVFLLVLLEPVFLKRAQ